MFSSWSSIFSGSNPSFSSPGYLVAFDGKFVDEGTGAVPDWADADCYTGANPTGQPMNNDCAGWTTNSGTATATELDAYLLLHQETSHACTDWLAVMCVTVAGAP